MTAIPARDLRNHTAEVLRRVEAGEEIEVFKDNRPVAKIVPLSRRQRWLPASEVARELLRLGPDTTGLAEELGTPVVDLLDSALNACGHSHHDLNMSSCPPSADVRHSSVK